MNSDFPQNPAEQNPYYILATLHNDSPSLLGPNASAYEHDRERHERNRNAWNAWACQGMSDEEKAKLNLVDLPDLKKVMEEVKRKLSERGLPYALPDPTLDVDFSGVLFSTDANFSGFIFRGGAHFHAAIFRGGAHFHAATFSDAALFQSATFNKRAYFRSTIFQQHSYFQKAKFLGQDAADLVDFTDANFDKPANFRDAKFNAYPILEGTNLHSKTKPAAPICATICWAKASRMRLISSFAARCSLLGKPLFREKTSLQREWHFGEQGRCFGCLVASPSSATA